MLCKQYMVSYGGSMQQREFSM